MKIPLQITFRNMEPLPIAQEWIGEEAAKLETFYKHLIGCRVAIEIPHHHQRKGSAYHIRIDLTVPGRELVIKRQPSLRTRAWETGKSKTAKQFELDTPHRDLRQAIDDAFKAAARRLQDYARRQSGRVKAHEHALEARITTLVSDHGYGFLTTQDGRELYFHRDSVLKAGFDRLRVGSKVTFVEEQGEKGPQASTVRIHDKRRIRNSSRLDNCIGVLAIETRSLGAARGNWWSGASSSLGGQPPGTFVTLKEYRSKRRFGVTPEPQGKKSGRSDPLPIFVVQKHLATRLHYDFRLEWNGVLLSWAVPKGPSTDPLVKRLAMPTEDHPIEYAKFEGVIPAGEYGAGTVMVWDTGTWEAQSPDVDAALEKGDLKFILHGKKLHGSWVLVRTRGFGSSTKPSWLLIKHRDEYASAKDITVSAPASALSRRLLADIARDSGGDVEKASTGDPKGAAKVPARAKKREA